MIMIRLQKWISQNGYCSRRKAEDLIVQGAVSVNGSICQILGTKINPEADVVSILGKPLTAAETKVYYAFYKPKNVVSTLSDPEQRITIKNFIQHLPERVFSVGRLDFDSEGLLILTNDGDFAQRISHPSYGVLKYYHVEMNRLPSLSELNLLRRGAMVEGRQVKPISVEHQKRAGCWVQFVLQEGRNREIRVICESVQLNVMRLIRVGIGRLKLPPIKPGELKKMSERERDLLFA